MTHLTESGSGPTIGLALGGGGARGLAHIPVLETFDELGLKPAMITGTSIGAIFGAAYACGLPAGEIAARAVDMLSRPAEIARRLFSGTARNLIELWALRSFSATLLDAVTVIETVFPEAAETDFADVAIPFRATATDYHEQSPVVLDRGRLAPAIAASMALPALFRAVEHQGRVLSDGGLTNPLPYDLLRPDCSLTVAIDVTGHLRLKTQRTPTALEAVLATSQIMQNAIVREKLARERPDILIVPPVESFRVLEFYKIRGILKAAAPVKDELKRALDERLSAAP